MDDSMQKELFSEPIHLSTILSNSFFLGMEERTARISAGNFLLHAFFKMESKARIDFKDVAKSVRKELDTIFPEAKGKHIFINIQFDEFQVLPQVALEIFRGIFGNDNARDLHSLKLFVQCTFTGLDENSIVERLHPSLHKLEAIELYQLDSKQSQIFMENAFSDNAEINVPQKFFETEGYKTLLAQMGNIPRFLEYLVDYLSIQLKKYHWDSFNSENFNVISRNVANRIVSQYSIKIWESKMSSEGILKFLCYSVFKTKVINSNITKITIKIKFLKAICCEI